MLHVFLYSTSPKPPIVPGMAILSLVSLGLNLLGLLGLAYALLVEPGEDLRLAGDWLAPVSSSSDGQASSLAQVVVNDLELDGMPQPMPRAREDPVQKLVP